MFKLFCCLFLCVVGAAATIVQAATPVDTVRIEEPQLLGRGKPRYPEHALELSLEGWLLVEFDVLPDGTTDKIAVTDGFNLKEFADSTVAWLEKQKYVPGTADGMPVLYHWNQSFEYSLQALRRGVVRAEFLRIHYKIKQHLERKEYAAVKADIEQYLSADTAWLSEYSILKVALFIAELNLGEPFLALDAIRDATREGVVELDQTHLIDALKKRFVLDFSMHEYKDALATLDRLQKLESLAPDDPISKYAATIRSALSGDAAIEVPGRLNQKGSWNHELARPTFTIAYVDGRVDRLTIQCDLAIAQTKYQPDFIWSVQGGWGKCWSLVVGAPGTKFKFYELQPNDPMLSTGSKHFGWSGNPPMPVPLSPQNESK